MTYRELIDSLFSECIQKSNTYKLAAGSSVYCSHEIANLKKEWETAEDAYESYLNLIVAREFNPNDIVTEILAELVLPPGVTFQQSSYLQR